MTKDGQIPRHKPRYEPENKETRLPNNANENNPWRVSIFAQDQRAPIRFPFPNLQSFIHAKTRSVKWTSMFSMVTVPQKHSGTREMNRQTKFGELVDTVPVVLWQSLDQKTCWKAAGCTNNAALSRIWSVHECDLPCNLCPLQGSFDFGIWITVLLECLLVL